MSVLYVLISACLCMAALFLAAFIWSVKSGQYVDDYTPSVRILFDNIDKPNSTNKTKADDNRKV